jgi:hypothetical protein
LDKHKHYFFKNPKVKQYYFQNIAIAQLRLKQVAASQESILKAWKAYPKSFSTGIRMLLFHFPFIAKKIWK